MRKVLIVLLLFLSVFALPVEAQAMEFTAPEAPASAQKYMPENTETFAEGLWSIIKEGIAQLQPAVAETARICTALIASVILLSLTKHISGISSRAVNIIGILVLSGMLIRSSTSLIQLGVDTVSQVSDYGKLLIPVMSGAMAAQGGVSASTALYTGTAVFDAFLSTLIADLLAPMLYVYLCLAIANIATEEGILGKLRDFIKWLITWGLKISLYVFTGYMGLTGVVSGSADAASIKAAKLTISGMVPVVGGILSDASETILVSAGIMKGAVGIYGVLAICAIWIGPFLKIGVQYLLLKSTAAICEIFGTKQSVGLIKSFSTAMGLVLAMTGAVCLMLLISIVCFMKGVS